MEQPKEKYQPIALKKDTYTRADELREKRETWDQFIRRILDIVTGLDLVIPPKEEGTQ